MFLMYRLSLIIDEIYLKYLPLAKRAGLTLNLDFPDPTLKIAQGEKVKKGLEKSLKTMLKKSFKGEITIRVTQDGIEIEDSGTVLSKTACLLLSNDFLTVKSKVGFGTTVVIKFKPLVDTV